MKKIIFIFIVLIIFSTVFAFQEELTNDIELIETEIVQEENIQELEAFSDILNMEEFLIEEDIEEELQEEIIQENIEEEIVEEIIEEKDIEEDVKEEITFTPTLTSTLTPEELIEEIETEVIEEEIVETPTLEITEILEETADILETEQIEISPTIDSIIEEMEITQSFEVEKEEITETLNLEVNSDLDITPILEESITELPVENTIESTPTIELIFTPTPIPTLLPQLVVNISTSRRPVMDLGEPIILTSQIENSEYYKNITYQWECDKGNGFEIVEDATESTYSYPATLESFSWSWRLIIHYNNIEENNDSL